MSTLFSLGGLPTHPQNPKSWRTSFSLLVWPLSYGLSDLGDPKVPVGLARKVIEARKAPNHDKVETIGRVDATGYDGNASTPKQVKRPNPWKMMVMMTGDVL